jgi:hypothetical protein
MYGEEVGNIGDVLGINHWPFSATPIKGFVIKVEDMICQNAINQKKIAFSSYLVLEIKTDEHARKKKNRSEIKKYTPYIKLKGNAS